MEKKEPTIFNNILRVLMSNFWVTAIGMICSFVFPKIMTIDGYALYHTFTLYVGYVAILHLGFPTGMVINYAGQDYTRIDQKQYKSEYKLILCILLLFSAIGAIATVITKNKMMAYVSIAIFPVCVLGSYKALYQAWSLFEKYTRINMIISACVPLICVAYYFIFKDIPGYIYIVSYLMVYLSVALVVIIQEASHLRRVKSAPMLSEYNLETEKVGILLVLGNYINTLFVSVDKQFVNCLFGRTEFAFYSFAMSMQAIMTVFITSISQPFFPAMAQGKFTKSRYNEIKEILLIFGSYSGCAYFVTAFIVQNFIEKYIGSLAVTGIYFVVFPAMAIINCLYVNLYKIEKKTKMYVKTLVCVLCLAIVLNLIAVKVLNVFSGVAVATTCVYYFWLFIGTRQFKYINITLKDVLYLAAYFILFFVITRTMNCYSGFVCYFVAITVLVFVCYGKHFNDYLSLYKLR